MGQPMIHNEQNMPIIPLRGLVVFPNMTLHFDVGRQKSVSALKYAMEHNQSVFLSAQKDAGMDEPGPSDIFDVGVVAKIKQIIRLPGSENIRVAVEGRYRAVVDCYDQTEPFFTGYVSLCLEEETPKNLLAKKSGYLRTARKKFEQYAAMVPKLSSDIAIRVMTIEEPGELADYIASNAYLDFTAKQNILSQLEPMKRLAVLCVELEKETLALATDQEIHEKLQELIDKNQREYYLREEMKVIATELGEENSLEESDRYRTEIAAMPVSDEIKEKLYKECDRLMKMPAGSHEATVVRGYLETCLEIPFGRESRDSLRLDRAAKLLDREHYGLEKVKQRVLEAMAVRKLAPDISGQILCLAGPPGVGKTSIAKSLAKAMNRQYVRVSLGGVRDEAEIRGHRKTYIGSMPGRIISAVKQAGTMNPLILLDEIDKLSIDVHGDPASALLEALDPEQNSTFTDHYIDFPVDLSQVLFVTTANDVSTIPEPLLDRMELIELSSYTHEEKFQIAKRHLLKKQMARHGLDAKKLRVGDAMLHRIIEEYTREAGVRNLERELAAVCRKAAAVIAGGEGTRFTLSQQNLEEVLGAPKYKKEQVAAQSEVGIVNGLAWTRVGGTMLPIEISALDGTGKIELTGNLGSVMQESAKTAVSYVRSRAKDIQIDSEFYKKMDIHINAPESAVTKDGPSAGIDIHTALESELTHRPVKYDVAMTGEITLKGKVLPIGGLKEKTMAAYRAGIQKVIIPFDNQADLQEIDGTVKEAIRFYPVKTYDEVLPIALDAAPDSGKQKRPFAGIVAEGKHGERVIAQ
ncbi:MAG: endopeptidase La [Clostridiales bacterium]|nr:endopeptidase La [Clostridiales bacterium]